MRKAVWTLGLLFAVVMSGSNLNGQCTNCDGQWPPGTLSTTSNNLQTVSTCMWGGDYALFNVTAGETYTWTTCGGGTWDTQLTLYAGGAPGCQGAVLAYNDDFPGCGLLSTITWTATFTGTVNLLVSRFNCQSFSSCMGLYWACTSCGTSSGNYNNPGGTITTCTGNFYDTGGPTGNYGNNQYITTTFCPDVSGECINMSFSQFHIEAGWDFLTVYDGPNTGAPVIGVYSGTVLQGITLSATNPSGCLTFLFDSDATVNYAGWSASISCGECGVPPPAPPTDCIGGVTVCDDATFSGNSSGSGAIADLNASNQGCLLSNENQTSWYLFSPATDGNIGFTISPGVGVDYDFAIWGPYPEGTTSADVCPPQGLPIRCSFASGGITNLNTGSYDTGIGHATFSAPQFASPLVTYTDGTGNALNGWVPGLNVTAGQVYILVIDNFSANTTPFNLNWDLQNGASLDCTPLPVELLELTGTRQGHHNVLRWKTASETNSDYYSVERSTDGSDYRHIGTVQAAGFSSSALSYVYRDENPGDRRMYYRLKQVDFDGKFEYLGPVAIEGLIAASQFSNPYPNPSESGEYLIPVKFSRNFNLHYTLFDATGRPVLHKSFAVTKGHQTLQIDGAQLASGVYQLQFSDDLGQVLHTTSLVK